MIVQFQTWLERYAFQKFILEISIATLEKGGVTSNLHTYQFLAPIDAWGLPKYPERTLILPPNANIAEGLHQFIEANYSDLYAPGTWINPLTQCCHLDITEIFPSLAEARCEALKRAMPGCRSIVALYNFKHDQTVYL